MPTNEELQQQIDELRERLEDRREIEEIKQLLINHQHDGIDTYNFKGKLSKSQKGELVNGNDTTLHTHDSRYYTETEIDNAGYMTDLVNDTTPQLGGKLDTNGKSITSESGKIQRHFLHKSLSDNVQTNLFDVSGISSGDSGVISITYFVGFADSNGVEIQHGKVCYLFGCDSGGIHSNNYQQAYDDGMDRSVDIGSGYSLGVSFAASHPSAGVIRSNTTVNTGSGNSPTITAIIEILSNTNLTYTEQ